MLILKYFPKTSFFQAKLGLRPYYIRRSIINCSQPSNGIMVFAEEWQWTKCKNLEGQVDANAGPVKYKVQSVAQILDEDELVACPY